MQGGQAYTLTFCKPGSNENVYKITAIPDLIVADAAIKAGCSSQLVAQMPGSGGSISWSGTDPATNAWLSCTNCPTPTITPPLNTPLTSVTYNVTWTGTNFACSSPISSTKQVTVSIVPPPTLSISPAAPRFCANAISAISANVAGAGTYLVRWFSGSNATGAQIGTGPTFTPPATAGTTAYSVRVEDVSNPCNFTVSNFNVQIDPAPVFDIPDITLCVDDERRVTLSTQNTYSWSSTSGIRAYPNAVYGITSAASGTYSVTATNGSGCTFTDAFQVSSQLCTNCPLNTTSCTVQSATPFTKIEEYISAGGAVSFPCTVPSSGITMLSESISGGTCPKIIVRSYRIVDNCGNQDTCVHTIRVEDTIPPVFTTAAPVFAPIACDQALPAQPNLSASDNCSASVVKSIDSYTVNSCSGYSVTYRWRATDQCGNWVETTSVIQVLPDGQPPTFTSFPADITINCDSIPALQTPTVSDNCDTAPSLTVSTVETPGACSSAKTIRHTWTLRDKCGNTTVRTQTITVIDNVAPVFFGVPSNRTDPCSNISSPANPTVLDNCTPTSSLNVVFTEVKSNISCPNTYTLTRTWTATDLCNNSKSVSQTIQVRDVVAPVFTNPPAAVTVSCENIPAVPTVAATDNCDPAPVVVYAQTRINGTCAYRYTLTRTWTATDACGNQSVHTQTIAVQDNAAPTFLSFPADTSVSCSGIPAASSPAFSDNCDPNPAIAFTEVNVAGGCPYSYTIRRTWTISDVCGNSFSRTQTLTVSDTTKPVFSQYPPNVLVSCSSIPAAPVLTASDNCAPPPTVNFSQVIGASCAATYTITRTWTASDLCGNQRTHTQVITVQDDQAPQFVQVPGDTTVSCTAVPPVPTVGATDNCTANPVVQFTETRINGSCSYNYVLSRKWTATDLCGNIREHIQTITVKDDIGPTLLGVPADATASCQSIPLPATPSATDNCDNSPKIRLDISTQNGICPGSYTILRKWTARDTCGNETTQTQQIVVSDTQPPQITAALSDQTVSCNAIPGLPTIAIQDVCDPNPVLSFQLDSLPGSCPGNYVLTRTWTARDWCNNASSVVQKITVQDVSAPTLLNFPADQTLSCDSIPSPPSLQASDVCDPNPVVTLVQSGGGFCNGSSLTRTWTARDWCGNIFSKTQLIQIQDNTPPVITGVPGDATVDCASIPSKANPTATDNCDPAPVLQFSELKGGSCTSSYTITRTWTARDSCGNSSTKVQVITVQDSQAPQWLNAPADIDVSCTNIPIAPNLSASDNCDGNPVTSFTETKINGACPYSYTLEREWVATDSCGNIGRHKQIIRVKDTAAPVLSGIPGNVTVPCDGIPSPANPAATDNCDPNPTIQFAEVKVPGTCAHSYTLRRTWTASDLCGNRDSAVQLIQVIDNQPPVISNFPADTSVSCNQIPAAATPSVADACDTSRTLTKSENIAPGTCPGSYTLERTWVATDHCGNSSFKTQRIQVRDLVAPVLQNVPASTTVNCGMVPAPAAVSATDNCDADPDVSLSETRSAGCSGSYAITRTWTAVDACGNRVSASQIITVVDAVPPVLSATPANVAVSCTQIPAVPAITASDNCTQALVVVFSETTTPGSCPGNFTLSRKWTAVDSCGNMATHVQLIQVSDVLAPVFSNVPADIQVNCGSIPAVLSPTITDNCDNTPSLVFTETIIPGTCPQNYTIERLWTARDVCGNQSTAKQLVKIVDPIAPVLSALPGDKTVACDQIPAAETLTLRDNCDPAPVLSYRQDTIAGSCPSNFILVRSWTGRDACGNSTTGSQTITVRDQVAPVLVGIPASATLSCASVPLAPNISVSDNCDPNPFLAFAELITPGTCPGNRTITRTWSAGDACGNTVSATQVLTIRDTEAPTFTNPPGNLTVSCKDIPTTTSLIATDNCDPTPTVTFTEITSPDCSGSYTITRTWVAKDNCGNTRQHQQIVTVVDTEKPQLFGIPQDQTLVCGQQPIAPQPVVLDNCDANPRLVFTQDSIPGACPSNYRLVKTWRATDRCGNTTEKTQTLSFSDNQAPTWSNIPSDLSLLCSDPLPNAQPIASDNCGSAFAVVFKDSLSAPLCPQNYTLTRRWTATDACGNSSSVVQKIEVKDQTAPLMQGLPMDVGASCSNVPATPIVTATDNCDLSAKVSFNEIKTPGSCVNTYTLKRTWTARDACSNESKYTQTVQIEDKIPPVLESPPADVVVRCKEAVPAMPSLKWTDNCSGTGSVAGVDISDGKTPETITRTWRIADACGFSTSVSQKIQIVPMQGTAGNDGPVCEGGAVSLSASGGTTYQWTGPANFSSSGANPAISTITASKAGTYTVVVKDPMGCALTLKTDVVVKIPPVTPLSVRICRGTSYTLNGRTFTTAGTFPVVFRNAAANGCDSTVLLQVEVIDAARQTIEVYICPGSSFSINGKSYTAEGTYEERLVGEECRSRGTPYH